MITKSPSFRWTVCLLLFFATTINYVDRQILSLLKPLLDQELHWTNEQFGWINALFQGAYALSYFAFGFLIDRFGTKIGYAVSISLWSIAAAAHALVSTVTGFALARVALGAGEGGNFPAAIKAIAEWFPKHERPYATALFNSGSNFGALLAPAIVPVLALSIGWRGTFIAAGVAGFVWLAFWLYFFRTPIRSDYADSSMSEETAAGEEPIRWAYLFRYRQLWAYLVAKILTDPVWWFFLIWLPDYFKKSHGLDLKTMGLPLVVIYAIITVLSVVGSWGTKRLVETGWSINRTRKVSLFIFACCVLPIVFATSVNLWFAVVLIGIAGAAHQAWSATLFSTVSDCFPTTSVASVVGLGGLVGGIGGMAFPIICGRVLDTFGGAGYFFLFAFCGSAYLIAFAANSALCPRFEPVMRR